LPNFHFRIGPGPWITSPMNARIIFFNICYYLITIGFIVASQRDPSSSLGYGFLIIGFWAVAGVLLAVLWLTRAIRPRSVADKIGIFTATPVLTMVVIFIILGLTERVSSEEQFNVGQYRYKRLDYRHPGSSGRIEMYRSTDRVNSKGDLDNDSWVKDSTWIYLSAAGDTVRKEKYRHGEKIF
jgi:hypothetical protein